MIRSPVFAAAVAPLVVLTVLTGCVAPVGPVEVTRFHLPDTARLGRGAIAVEPAPGMDGDSLEFRSYAAAIGRRLALLGYSEQATGSGDQVALVRFERQHYRPNRHGGPVSVGVGGATGSYGSGVGVGVGVGIDLSGPPPEIVETELAVTIRDRASGQSLWEGRASFRVTANSPLADTQLGAAKMSEALFQGFPGNSGETIEVK
jgi:hypothetical protein